MVVLIFRREQELLLCRLNCKKNRLGSDQHRYNMLTMMFGTQSNFKNISLINPLPILALLFIIDGMLHEGTGWHTQKTCGLDLYTKTKQELFQTTKSPISRIILLAQFIFVVMLLTLFVGWEMQGLCGCFLVCICEVSWKGSKKEKTGFN